MRKRERIIEVDKNNGLYVLANGVKVSTENVTRVREIKKKDGTVFGIVPEETTSTQNADRSVADRLDAIKILDNENIDFNAIKHSCGNRKPIAIDKYFTCLFAQHGSEDVDAIDFDDLISENTDFDEQERNAEFEKELEESQ